MANMDSNGVHVIDGNAFRQIEFITTGKGAHGLYFSRESKYLYVSNRGEGSVSLIDLATRKVAKKWTDSRRRKSGYGRRLGRWQSAVALRPL